MSEAGFQLFNLNTMSGVFPGTRTQVFQRVRLAPLPGSGEAAGWAQILWYDDPPACAVYRLEEGGAPPVPLLRIPDPAAGDLIARLDAGLRAAGRQVQVCGSCVHLRRAGAQTPDGLRAGTCALRRAGSTDSAAGDAPAQLALQGELALACPHWQDAGERAAATSAAPALPIAPLPKAAEVSESKLKPWARWRVRLLRRLKPPPSLPAAQRLLERSGVGAGTEPCFACQGRIANLAALAVESDEGDKQTFSVWRCRNCYTVYLNDWVDRWERTDSLETEETIYRVAPVEAAEFLTLIDAVAGGDHPGRRAERRAERAWFLAAVAGRAPLSRIVKQGR